MMNLTLTTLSNRTKCIVALFFISITLFIYGCLERNSTDCKLLETINIDLDNLEAVKYSDVFENIRYVKLETSEDNIIGSVTKVCISGDKFYLLSPYPLNTVSVFNRDGKFLFHIKNSGRGPGEFINLTDIQVNEYIWLLDRYLRKLFKYSLNGEFLEVAHLGIKANKFIFLNDNTLVFYSNNTFNEINNELANYQLIFMELSSYEIVNCALPFRENMKNIRVRDFVNFNSLNNSIYFSHSYDDTIYQISSQMQVTPKLYFNFGKYKITEDILQKEYRDGKELEMTIRKNNLVSVFGFNFREVKNIMFSSFIHNRQMHHLIISKKSGLTFCYNTLINDIEGYESSNKQLYDFQPVATTENGMIVLIEPMTMIKGVNEVKELLNNSEWESFRKGHLELIEIYESSKEIDNPIIGIYEFKDF